MRFSCEGFMRGPAMPINSTERSYSAYSEYTGQFRCMSRNSINREVSVCSSITSLFEGCFPSAIIGTVPLIIVDPSECSSVGPVSHVCKEIGKCSPPFTDSNPPPSVVLPLGISRPVASVHHFKPKRVNGGSLCPSAKSMLKISLNCGIDNLAATGFRCPGPKRHSDNLNCFTAVANTLVSGLSTGTVKNRIDFFND